MNVHHFHVYIPSRHSRLQNKMNCHQCHHLLLCMIHLHRLLYHLHILLRSCENQQQLLIHVMDVFEDTSDGYHVPPPCFLMPIDSYLYICYHFLVAT